MTNIARLKLRQRNLLLSAAHRFLESDLHVITQVRSTLRPTRIAATLSASEQIIENAPAARAAAENFAENFKRIMETPAASPRAAESTRPIKRRMPILIISRALLRIRK